MFNKSIEAVKDTKFRVRASVNVKSFNYTKARSITDPSLLLVDKISIACDEGFLVVKLRDLFKSVTEVPNL